MTDLFFPCSEPHPDSAREDKRAVGILYLQKKIKKAFLYKESMLK